MSPDKSPDTPNVMQAMIQIQQGKTRAETANKVVQEAEKEKDTDEKSSGRTETTAATEERTHS